MKRRFAESELIINSDGSVFHLHLKPEQLADKVLLVGDPGRVETVAKYFNINKDDLASNKRSNEIAFPRQIAMYLCREVANMSYPKIGEDFGNRDHSTVMHACKKIEKEVKDKNNTRLIVESVKNIIINGEQ